MLTLPDAIVSLLVPFATLFTSPTWRKAQVLLIGAILEVLNRAVWSSREVARILLVLLLQHLDGGDGPLIFGIDETLERRRGAKIRARAIYQIAGALAAPVNNQVRSGRGVYGHLQRTGAVVAEAGDPFGHGRTRR